MLRSQVDPAITTRIVMRVRPCGCFYPPSPPAVAPSAGTALSWPTTPDLRRRSARGLLNTMVL
eukprot:6207769-Pleurochrysis_carterae.AAC.1